MSNAETEMTQRSATRYCICISGQLRSPHLVLPAIAEKTAGLDAQFVFSVWDRVGRKSDGAVNIHQLPGLFENDAAACIPFAWIGAANFWSALPLLQAQLRDQEGPGDAQGFKDLILKHFPNAVVDIEDAALMDLEFPNALEDRHSIRMLYKIWRTNEIARRLTREGPRFDVIVRLRPDTTVEALDFSEVEAQVKAGRFLVDTWMFNAYCGDIFAAGRPEDMDVYAGTFGRALLRPVSWNYIHTDLCEVLQNGNINVLEWSKVGIFQSPDSKLTAAALCENISAMKGHPSYGALHEIVLVTAMALGQMQQGRFDAALQDLMRVVSLPELRVPRMANGWLYVLAKALERQGQSDVAALVALAGLNLDKELQWIIHDLKTLVHSKVHIRPDGAGLGVFHDPGAVLEWLQASPDLIQILEANLGMPAGAFMEQYQVPRLALYSVIRLIEEQKSAERLSLAIAALQELKLGDLEPGQAAGLAYWAKGNTAGAAEDRLAILRLLGDLSPNSPAVLYELADFLKTSGVFSEAADVQARAVALDPRHSGARRQFAELLALTGENRRALAEAATAVELNASPHHLWLLAYLQAVNGNLKAGRDMVRPLAVERNFPVDYQRLPDFDATVAKLVSLP